MPALRHIWITRAEPAAWTTAARLAEEGFEALVAPLLAARPLAGARLDLAGIGALAFTSGQAVRAFAELTAERPGPVFAVGEATAEAARAAGFRDVRSADGDVKALAGLIAGQAESLAGPVLHPAAVVPAGDLAGDLAALGVAARTLALYETLEQDPAAAVLPRLASLDAALVHSPRAARALAGFLDAHPAPHLTLFALSEAVAEPLARLNCQQVSIAPFPNEPSLLNLLFEGR
jgi:uroporphyrinogen-III synthase